MLDIKPWYKSRTIWASIIGVALAGASALGFPVDGIEEGEVADLAMQAIGVLSGLVAIYGRAAARSRIGS